MANFEWTKCNIKQTCGITKVDVNETVEEMEKLEIT